MVLRKVGFRIYGCILCLQFTLCEVCALEIVNAYPQFMEEQSFQRISEFFSGVEKAGPYLIVRTQPQVRGGEYFVITLDQRVRSLPEGTQIILEVVRPDSHSLTAYTLELPEKRPNTRQIYAGITGSEWPDSAIRPLAWKISFINSQGTVIAEKQSYLWTYP